MARPSIFGGIPSIFGPLVSEQLDLIILKPLWHMDHTYIDLTLSQYIDLARAKSEASV